MTTILDKLKNADQVVENGKDILLIFLSSAIYTVKMIKEGERSPF